MKTLALGFACLLLFGCGGDDSTSGPDGSTADATADQAVPDAAGDAPSTDGSSTDGSSTDAGVGDSSMLDANIPDADFGCTDPTTCDGGAPFCCAQLVLGQGQPPSCPISSITSACASKCATQLSFSCNTTETVRFCSANADCTEKANPMCCVFKQNNQQVTFCASSLVANYADHCL